jgi:hypothetical protein
MKYRVEEQNDRAEQRQSRTIEAEQNNRAELKQSRTIEQSRSRAER